MHRSRRNSLGGLVVRRFVIMLAVLGVSVLTPLPAQAATTVALWHMDDLGSTMADSSGNQLNGALKNVRTGLPGVQGTAFQFQGTPSVVSVPNNAKLNPGPGTFTATVRVKFSAPPTSAVGDYDLIRKGLSGTPGGHWKMEIRQSGKAYCYFKGSAGRLVLSAGPNLANNAWHTITCQRAGDQVRLTVDGAVYTKTGPTGTIANSSVTFVGAKGLSGGDQYTGLMDEVSLSVG